MPNKNYLKGRRKEYKIVKELKEEGYDIAQRSAGSHSPIDIFAINSKTKVITLVQAKPDNFSELNTQRIYNELEWLNGMFRVEIKVI